VGAIAGFAFSLYADRLFKAGLLEGSNIAPLDAIIAVAVDVGFLPHNLDPAKIIMGYASALFLGLLMATTTITVGGRTADQFSGDRKSTRLNSSHLGISYAVFCLKKKKQKSVLVSILTSITTITHTTAE